MSFFKKIKKSLGISTAKVEINMPQSVMADTKEVSGEIVIMPQNDQRVQSIKIRLEERTFEGYGEEQETHTTEISSLTFDEPFDLKKDEEKRIDFSLPIFADSEEGISFNLFGATVSFSADSSDRGSHFVVATVDLEGVALDPRAEQVLHVIEP